MKTQIRDRVFETNSSSSHSVTIDSSELKDFGLDREALREGVIRVVMPSEGYGWEWRRYYKPEHKIAYLLLQLQGGHLSSDVTDNQKMDDDHSEHFREDYRSEYFLRTIEEATGCRVVVTRDTEETGWGYSIDHDSVGKGVDHLGDEDEILKLVFGRNSYVETGNDNEYPPEKICSDDRGDVQYFEPILVDGMPEGNRFRLTEHDGEGWNKNIELGTPEGERLATPDVTWEFRKKIQELITQGDVVIGGFHVVLPYADDATAAQLAAFARRTAYEKHIDYFRGAENMKVLRDFEVTVNLKPYERDLERGRNHRPAGRDYARQASVTLVAVARDATVDRLRELVADAEDYAPKKKEPSA
jgi:hypothetical protein